MRDSISLRVTTQRRWKKNLPRTGLEREHQGCVKIEEYILQDMFKPKSNNDWRQDRLSADGGATGCRPCCAFDIASGEVLWSPELPLSAVATPMTYQLADGKQYVAVAAEGHGKKGLPTGDDLMAFAMP